MLRRYTKFPAAIAAAMLLNSNFETRISKQIRMTQKENPKRDSRFKLRRLFGLEIRTPNYEANQNAPRSKIRDALPWRRAHLPLPNGAAPCRSPATTRRRRISAKKIAF